MRIQCDKKTISLFTGAQEGLRKAKEEYSNSIFPLSSKLKEARKLVQTLEAEQDRVTGKMEQSVEQFKKDISMVIYSQIPEGANPEDFTYLIDKGVIVDKEGYEEIQAAEEKAKAHVGAVQVNKQPSEEKVEPEVPSISNARPEVAGDLGK